MEFWTIHRQQQQKGTQLPESQPHAHAQEEGAECVRLSREQAALRKAAAEATGQRGAPKR